MMRKECDSTPRHRIHAIPYSKVFDENKVASTVQIILKKFYTGN